MYKAASTEVVCKDSSSTTKTCSSVADSNNNVSTITITDACSAGCASGAVLQYTISKVYNPGSTKPISTSFQANTQTSSGYLIDSGSAITTSNFALIVNSLTSVSVDAPTGTIVVGAVTDYRFTVVPNNPIPSGGQLLVIFPSQFEVQSAGSCSAVISSVSYTCTKDSATNTVTSTFTNAVASGTSISVRITNGVKNPTIAQTSSNIVFTTSITVSGTEYGIDQDQTSVTVTPTTYGTLTSTSVTRVDSSKINEVTNINIKATSANPITTSSILKFKFPLDQVVLNVATADALTYYQLDASGNVGSQLTALSTTSDASYITVTIREWCSSGSTSCPANTENIRLRVVGFKNPGTTLPPSNSFIIFVDSNGGFKIDSKESGLFATPSIQAGPLSSVTIRRDTNVVGASTTYTIDFTTSNSLTEANGIFLSFAPPSGLMYEGSSVSCTYNSASVTSTSCQVTTQSSSYGNEVTRFRVPMTCTSNTCAAASYSVTFTGLKNPFSTKAPTGTITVATQGYNGAQYYNNDVLDVDIATSATLLQTLTPNTCTGTAVRSVTSVDANVEITVSVTLTNRILAGSYIRIKIPLEQFAKTGATIQYKQSGGSSISVMSEVSTDTNHITVEYVEFCNGGGTLCVDGTTMEIVITQGFKNARTIPTSTSQYLIFQSWTSDQSYQVDESPSGTLPTKTLTQAAISSISASFQSSTTTYDGYVDISAVLGSTLLSTDYIEFTFSSEFVLDSGSSITCGKVTSGTETSVTCSTTTTSGYLSTVKVTEF